MLVNKTCCLSRKVWGKLVRIVLSIVKSGASVTSELVIVRSDNLNDHQFVGNRCKNHKLPLSSLQLEYFRILFFGIRNIHYSSAICQFAYLLNSVFISLDGGLLDH